MALPTGFEYIADFLSSEEERSLVAHIGAIDLAPVVMRGYTARRRTAHFGAVYGYASWRTTPGPPMPEWLDVFRERAAAIAGEDPSSFTEALISEYPAGATIGWHRDAPQFGATVVGISLETSCRLRFRRMGPDGAVERAGVILDPRSMYVMAGPARSDWQHSIPAVAGLRYSITFRTVRKRV